jgi:hypothetical protein
VVSEQEPVLFGTYLEAEVEFVRPVVGGGTGKERGWCPIILDAGRFAAN